MSGVRYQVSDVWYQVSPMRFQIFGARCHVPGVSCQLLKVRCLRSNVSCQVFFSGERFWVSSDICNLTSVTNTDDKLKSHYCNSSTLTDPATYMFKYQRIDRKTMISTWGFCQDPALWVMKGATVTIWYCDCSGYTTKVDGVGPVDKRPSTD